jgi:hypothetical protein
MYENFNELSSIIKDTDVDLSIEVTDILKNIETLNK